MPAIPDDFAEDLAPAGMLPRTPPRTKPPLAPRDYQTPERRQLQQQLHHTKKTLLKTISVGEWQLDDDTKQLMADLVSFDGAAQ